MSNEESRIVIAARKTVAYLQDKNLLDGEHAITAALIEELAGEWASTSSTVQRANISRELRGAIKLLPGQQASHGDAAHAFFAGLGSASKSAELPPGLF